MEKKLGFSIEILGAQSAVQAAEELRRKITEVQKEIKKATDPEEFKKLQAELVDLRAKQAEVTKEVREQVKARQQELAVNNKNASTYKELSDRLNALRARYKDMAAAEQDATQEARELRVEIGQLDRRLKQIDGDVGQFQRNVGDYTGALSQFFPRIGGAIGGITDSLGFLKNQTTLTGKGFGALALGFAAFDGISALFQGINEQIAETRRLQLEVANLTGQTGEALQQGTAQAKAVAATYQQSATDIAVAANTVAKEFGISFTDALNIVEAGFRKGADAQGEFLQVVREYPAQFRDAGASAEEFLAVSIAASREGVYSDKGLDAVKEFGLRIREQTKATRDALTNALGPEFTQTLFDGLNNGSVSSVQALGQVTEALKENGVQGSELQTVIADVFGGPGEDVGQRFLFTLGEVLNATDDIRASTNEYQAQQQQLFEANLRLEESQKAYNEAFADTAFEFQVAKANGRAFLNETLAKLLEYFNILPARLKAYKALFSSIFSGEGLRQGLKDFDKVLAEQTALIKAEDVKQRELIKQQEEQAASAVERQRKKQEEERRKSLNTAGRKDVEAYTEGSMAALQAEKSKYEKALENTIGEPAQRVLVDKIAAVEAEINKQVENINRLRAEAGRAQDRELFGQLFGGGTLPGVGLPDEVTQIRTNEKAKTDEVFKAVQQRAAIRRKDIEKEQEEEQRRKEAVIAQIQDYTGAAFDILSAFSQRRNELENRRFEEAITQTETNIQQLEAKASQATGIRQRLLQKQVAQQQEVLKKQQADAEAARKKQAKEEKRIAIIQSIINGALAVQRALAVPPGPPFTIPSAIAAGIFAAIQTATIAAQPLATGGIVGISGRRVTDRQNMRSRANGDNVLATVRRGEVVLNERQQSSLGGARTFRAIGVPGFATGGAIGAPISAPAIPALTGAQGDFSTALAALDAKTDAINSRIDRFKVFVVSEEIGRDLAEAGALRAAATL
jgi:murein DD-endopeptidase MepM/ murein hydrolase activator NlpD